MNYDEIRAKNKAAIAAKREEQLRLFTKTEPPFDPKSIVDGTIIEGKSVAEWDALYTEISENGGTQDLTETFPGWTTWAIRAWRANGKPTPNSVLIEKVKKATEEAEKHVALAGVQLDRAKVFATSGNAKKAGQHRKYAETENTKAEFWWGEVAKLRTELKGTL